MIYPKMLKHSFKSVYLAEMYVQYNALAKSN